MEPLALKELINEVVIKTQRLGSNGCSTATILAKAIYLDGVSKISAHTDVRALQSGIDKAVQAVVKELKVFSQPVATIEEARRLATIFSGHWHMIGQIIADSFEKVGWDGSIAIEDSRTVETALDIVDGIEFEGGYLSPYFVTNSEETEAVLEDPYILIRETPLSQKELLPILESVAQASSSLLIICDEIEPKALSTLISNKLHGALKVCAVKTPRLEILEDLRVLTACRTSGKANPSTLSNMRLEEMGRVRRVVVDAQKTTLIKGSPAIA